MSGKKIVAIVVVVLALAGIATGIILHKRSKIIKVSTGKVVRQDLLSIVSGTGQIKPKTYVNIGATAFGRITHLNVKEGDHVRQGAILATVESVQPAEPSPLSRPPSHRPRPTSPATSQRKRPAEANILQAKADLEQKRLDFWPRQGLYDEKLIAKQDFDSKQAAYDMAVATLAQRQAALDQARAQTMSATSARQSGSSQPAI